MSLGVTRPRFSNILICDTHGDELVTFLRARRPDLICRVRTADTLTATDRVWADALIGFAVPVDLEHSSIRWVHSTGGRSRWPATRSPVAGRGHIDPHRG